MKSTRRCVPALPAIILVIQTACAARPTVRIGDFLPSAAEVSKDRNDPVAQAIALWPTPQRAVARLMRLEYGEPDKVTRRRLVWLERAPWKRIAIEGKGKRFLRQTAEYRTSGDRWRDIRRAPLDLEVNRGRQELTAVSDDEAKNFLTINIAHDVAAARLPPEQARLVYNRTLLLADSGKSIDAMETLTFLPYEARQQAILATRFRARLVSEDTVAPR